MQGVSQLLNKAASSQIFSVDFIHFLFSEYCWEKSQKFDIFNQI